MNPRLELIPEIKPTVATLATFLGFTLLLSIGSQVTTGGIRSLLSAAVAFVTVAFLGGLAKRLLVRLPPPVSVDLEAHQISTSTGVFLYSEIDGARLEEWGEGDVLIFTSEESSFVVALLEEPKFSWSVPSYGLRGNGAYELFAEIIAATNIEQRGPGRDLSKEQALRALAQLLVS